MSRTVKGRFSSCADRGLCISKSAAVTQQDVAMKIRYLAPSLLLVSVLSGCVSVSSARLETGPVRAAILPEQVQIYRSAAQVGAPYVEVALLNASGDYSMTSEGQMFETMRKKAAKIGANGVILETVSEPTTGQRVAQAF